MLLKNPLHPPSPRHQSPRAVVAAEPGAAPFVSPEDFDVTGVLAGMDCSESRYWWVPELHTEATSVAQAQGLAQAVTPHADDDRRQAAVRTADRSNAAA
jgi:hypothetical protein